MLVGVAQWQYQRLLYTSFNSPLSVLVHPVLSWPTLSTYTMSSQTHSSSNMPQTQSAQHVTCDKSQAADVSTEGEQEPTKLDDEEPAVPKIP